MSVEDAARFILSTRQRGATPGQWYWRPAAVMATIRSRWPEVTIVAAYREASRMQHASAVLAGAAGGRA